MDPIWLVKPSYTAFYAEAIVSIISKRGLSIDACHENQPNKCKLALYKLSIHFKSS